MNDIQLSAGVMTIYQEAGSQSDVGQLAVAYVIKNSCVYWGRTLTDEVFRRNRYSCWRDDSPTKLNLDQAGDFAIARATVAMLSAWYYLLPDPTVGAVFYLRYDVDPKPPHWEIDAYAPGEVKIGDHLFRPPKLTHKV